MTEHLNRLWNDHQIKSSYYLRPYKIIKIHWLYPYAVYYSPITYLFYIKCKIVPLSNFTFFNYTLFLNPGNHKFTLCIYLSGSFCSIICFAFWITYKLVSLWLMSLSIISTRSNHAVANGKLSFLWPSNIPVCVCETCMQLYIWNMSLSVHPLVDNLGCFCYLGYYK